MYTAPIKFLGGLVAVLFCGVAALGYYLYEATKAADRQRAELSALSQRLDVAASNIVKLESATRDLRMQLSVVRVALQQSTNVRVDQSGAIITKKGSKSDGIELR